MGRKKKTTTNFSEETAVLPVNEEKEIRVRVRVGGRDWD
jgi:hypothetical protein